MDGSNYFSPPLRARRTAHEPTLHLSAAGFWRLRFKAVPAHPHALNWRPNVISRTKSVARRALRLTIVLALIGCAQGVPISPAVSYLGATQTSALPATHFYGNDLMYTSQPSDNEVVVYKRKKKALTLKYDETLTSGFSKPMGMMSTPDGHTYIANSGASNVMVYRMTRKGPQGPVATLDDSGEVPINVAAAKNRRLVAVSNESTRSGGAGSVSVYLGRQTTPSRVLTYGSDP